MARLVVWGVGVAAVVGCSSEPRPGPSPAPRMPVQEAKPSVALGDLSELEPRQRRAFEAHPEDFTPLREAGPDDWLSSHPEPPQSVSNYWVEGPNRPGAQGRDTLYIMPLGEVPDLEQLQSFAADFFTLPVVVLPAADMADVDVDRRMNGKVEQLLAPDLQVYLRAHLPDDAYAMIGLTTEDLYPGEGWNYVFGFASLTDRTGVFSFARYDPRFWDPEARPDPTLATERAFKILAHEYGHMFGMNHCVHHTCLMNGANHAEELDGAPLSLCPVCLRKLHMLMEFDPQARYEALQGHYARAGLKEAEAFVRLRGRRMAGS